MADNPLVSVVIPTKNSEATIEKCLRSIRNQTYPNVEIIVVDTHSKDNTKKIVEKYGGTLIESDAGMSRARNIGADESQGELILSLDSDMELTQKVIKECVNKIKEGFDGLIIPEKSVGRGFWAKCIALEKSCYVGDNLIEAARFFKRTVFDAVGGYDRRLLFGEDKDFDIRAREEGFKIGRINKFIKHNEGSLNLWKNIRKKYQYGKTLDRYNKKHPSKAKQQLKLIRPAFIRNWRKIARDPVHALGMLFIKACEFCAVVLGSTCARRQ